jgi:hypothetical protein
MTTSHTAVSAELGVGLVGPEHTIVPLMASLYYNRLDPYAVRIAFHVGTDEPVEWTLARDLLAAALHAREGNGDVQAWPSMAPGDPAAGGDSEGTAAGHPIMNISMSSPFGHALFQVSAAEIAEFLGRTFEIVPSGTETEHIDFDTELANLLNQA